MRTESKYKNEQKTKKQNRRNQIFVVFQIMILA